MSPQEAFDLLSALVWPLLFVAVVGGCVLGIMDRKRTDSK